MISQKGDFEDFLWAPARCYSNGKITVKMEPMLDINKVPHLLTASMFILFSRQRTNHKTQENELFIHCFPHIVNEGLFVDISP